MTKSIGFTHKFNGGDAFEVMAHSKQYVVDVKVRNCSCGAWQLSGIPCPHSIPCLIAINRPPLDTVENCYKIDTFLKTYSHVLQPLEGMSQWPRDDMFPLQPPKFVKQAGRPKHSRNKGVDEVVKVGKKEKLKKWVKIHCGWCGEENHNVRRCEKKAAGLPKVNTSRGKGRKRPTSQEANVDGGDGIVDGDHPAENEVVPVNEEPVHLADIEPDLHFMEDQTTNAVENDQVMQPDEITQSTFPIVDQQTPDQPLTMDDADDIVITGVGKNPNINPQTVAREQRQARRYELKRQAKLGGTSATRNQMKKQRKK